MKDLNINIDIRLVRAFIYFMAALSGFTPMLLLAGYFFIFEKNTKVQEDIFNAFVLMIAYMFIKLVIGYIPMFANWFSIMLNSNNNFNSLNRWTKMLVEMVELARIFVLIKIGVDAYKGKDQVNFWRFTKKE